MVESDKIAKMFYRCVLKPNGLDFKDRLWTMKWAGLHSEIRNDLYE